MPKEGEKIIMTIINVEGNSANSEHLAFSSEGPYIAFVGFEQNNRCSSCGKFGKGEFFLEKWFDYTKPSLIFEYM